MKKLMYAYYEAHPTSGLVVECEINGRWSSSFLHEGDFESLYSECERRARLNDARLEAVILGLPKLQNQPREQTPQPSSPIVHTVMQVCFSFAKPEETSQRCFAFA